MEKITERPDLVVSIDFGMTCTGVAYCNVATGSNAIRHIQRWPGRMQANENKVPTLLVYPKNCPRPSSWGFQAETAQELSGEGHESREWFKTMLDEQLLEQMRKAVSDPSSVPQLYDVEKYTDYFQFLYRTVEARLKGELATSWEDAKIEFIFSVPTTWKPVPTVQRFRNIVSLAGFGSCPGHTASIGLTEAEAAAVYTARSMPGIFKENEVLLVCDAGGGTTDLSVLRVKDTFSGSLNLEQLDVVFGAAIGAAQLDGLFEKTVLRRLQNASGLRAMNIGNLSKVAREMRISKEFQNAKCDYGSEESFADTQTFTVRVPGLDRDYTSDEYGIRDGEMRFERDDLKVFFDIQISKLFDTIDRQLTRLQQKHGEDQVSHLVLSGGLGNSAYVQTRLHDKYASDHTSHTNASRMQIRVAPDPQLVVCKGNVANRVQKFSSGQSVLGWRCCRASYGVVCKILYNSKDPRHSGLRTERDILDGKLYIMDCIDWFIRQGQPVSSDFPIIKSFSRKCLPASTRTPNPPRTFSTEVVCSELDNTLLPMVRDSFCQSICKLESDFTALPLSLFKLKNRQWWKSGAKYHRIDYLIKVNIGAADISFELWHNGVKLSKDNAIKVEWQATVAASHKVELAEADSFRSILPIAAASTQEVYELHS